MPHIKSLIVAHKTVETTANPCITKNIPEDALCLFSNTYAFGSAGKSFNVTFACKDQFDYDSTTKKCIPPTNFILFASKDRIIRYRIRQSGRFNDDPYVILPISNIGQPVSLIFDSISPNRYFYWIDAHDRDGGRIKRASDITNLKTQHISLLKESNCSQIFDLEIDEIGRQIFVSCAPLDAGDIGFIHVWRIDEDDELEYIGKVVAGDRKSVATKSFPFPTKIAVFDCSRMLETPVIIQCQLDGRQCSVVVSYGLDCLTLQLEADLFSSSLIYTTFDGIWSKDVYVDGDLRRLIHYPQSPQYLSLAPFNGRSILIITSNETKNEEKLYKIRYDSSMQELSQLEATKLFQMPSQNNLKRISAVKVVGRGRIESSKLKFSCTNSECSHLCRIPYDTGSYGKCRYECLCPIDYSPLSESSTTCEKNLECQNWQFRCFNGKQCIHITRRCDGVADCLDRSDEQSDVCLLQISAVNNKYGIINSPQKSTVIWNCDSGKTTAIGLHLVCNGMADCVDDSDEKHCRCRSPTDDFDCTAWQKWAHRTYEEFSNEPNCIPRSLVCDGVPNCRNGADELPMLCSIINPIIENSDKFSLLMLFDITKKQPAYIIIIFAILFALFILSIGCCIYCCYRRRKTYQNNRTCPCSNTGCDCGYIPSHINIPHPSSTATSHLHDHGQLPQSTYGYHTLPYNRHHQQQHHINHQASHLQIPSSTTDLLPAPNNGGDLNEAFYGPPPSAASERASSRRLEKTSTVARRSNRQEEDIFKDESFNFSGPLSYSQIGPPLESSTPRSDRPPLRTKSGRHQREREKKNCSKTTNATATTATS
uniref:Uncharacterized protein n=1 Tax=Panagrolaimus davidi TaxID=227884 RepID=A0A914PM88_9BILA